MKRRKPLEADWERAASRVEAETGRLAKNTLLNFCGMAVPAAIGLVTLPAVIRWLGTERFGIFSWIMIILGYFGLFDLGLGRATIKFVAEAFGLRKFDEVGPIMWSAVGLQSLFGIVGALLCAALTPLLVETLLRMPAAFRPEARTALYWMAFSLPFNIVLPSFRGVLEAAQRFDLVNLVKIPTNSLLFVAPWAGALLKLDLQGIMILLVASRIAALIAWIWICWRVFPSSRRIRFLPWPRLRRIFIFGGWNTLSGLVWPLLVSLDRLMIGARLGAQALGFYAPPFEAVAKLGLIPGSLQMAIFPAFSLIEGRASPERGKALFAQSIKYMLLILAPLSILLIVFAPGVLHIWLGGEFAAQSARTLQWLALAYLIQSLTYVPYSFLQGQGRADLTLAFQVIELVVILPVFWLTLRSAGIAGAAAVVALRVALDLALLLNASRRRGGIDAAALKKAGLLPLAGAILLLLASVAGSRFALRGLGVFLGLGAGFALYGFLVWRGVLDLEERAKLRRFSRRLGRPA